MTDKLPLPGNLRTAAKFDRARELLDVLISSDDPDELADATAAGDADLAHGVMFELLARLRGWDDTRTGVERVAATYGPDPAGLWRPA